MTYVEFRYPDALRDAVPSLDPLICYRATLPAWTNDDMTAYGLLGYAALSVSLDGFKVYKQVQHLLKAFAGTSKKPLDYVLMSSVDRHLLWMFMAAKNDYHLPGFSDEDKQRVLRGAADRIPNEATGGMVCTMQLDALKSGEVIVGFDS